MLKLRCKQGLPEHNQWSSHNPFGASAKFPVGLNCSVSKSEYSGPVLAQWGQTQDDPEWGKPQQFEAWALGGCFYWLQWILEHDLSAIGN